MTSPSGDTQHLASSYAGSLITKVEVKKGTTVLETTAYAYNGTNELTKVTDPANRTVQYAYGSNGAASGSRYITSITDKKGQSTSLAWSFSLSASSP